MHGKLWTSYVEGADGRVMTNLLIIDGDAFNISLEGLSENGIERFLH
jgi:hypothetical protein